MTKPAKLAHVVLKTYDVERLRKWYCDVLDAHVVFEQLPYASFITYDEEHHRLAFAQIPGEVQLSTRKGPGLVHIAFTFSDIRALLEQYERLKQRGIEPGITINHGPTVSFYYSDPDGNAIELQMDRLNLEEGKRFMDTPAFRENSTGIPIDADALVRRMHEGADDAELLFYDTRAEVDVVALNQKIMSYVHMI